MRSRGVAERLVCRGPSKKGGEVGDAGGKRRRVLRALAPHIGRLLVLLVVVLAANTIASDVALATNSPFPGNGWTNPVAPASYEDWHFGSCDGYYDNGAGRTAHLGADSQGTRAN